MITNVITENFYAKTIYDMAEIFDCRKIFDRNKNLTKKSSQVMSKIIRLLTIAFMLSDNTPANSYKAYRAIYNMQQILKHRNIITESDIDNICFGVLTKSNNFLLLKSNLTAFELDILNKQAIEYNKNNSKSSFVNKFRVNELLSMAKKYSPCYTVDDLFIELNCSKPFLSAPKIVNKNTNDEHIEYLSHSGLIAYDKLITLIQYAHKTFDYPDITDKLDRTVDRECY